MGMERRRSLTASAIAAHSGFDIAIQTLRMKSILLLVCFTLALGQRIRPLGYDFYPAEPYYPARIQPMTRNTPVETDIESRQMLMNLLNSFRWVFNQLYPAAGSSPTVTTVYQYTTTVSTTTTQILASYSCIPLSSFLTNNVTPTLRLTGNCYVASGKRRKRQILHQSVQPTQVLPLEPSAAVQLGPDAGMAEPAIRSSQDGMEEDRDAGVRSKRQFNLNTILVNTAFTSTFFTATTSVSTLTGISSFTCLPPPYVVC